MVGDARRNAGHVAEEPLHLVLVAGNDDDEVLPLVLHHLEQHLDRLLAVVALVVKAVHVVGLVDEQHAAHRPLQDLPGLGCGVAHVLPDEVVPAGDHDVALPHEAQLPQDLAHLHGDRGLAGPGVAGEGHVQRRLLGLEVERAA